MGGMYEEKEDNDILFQNDDVCVLKPDSPRGILIFSRVRLNKENYKTDEEFEEAKRNICSEGVYSYNELKKQKPELGLTSRETHGDHDDLIFFRAPFTPDITTFESAYECREPSDLNYVHDNHIITVLLRIDPEKTFVYSSELRAKQPAMIYNSRKPMMKYLEIIDKNKQIQRPNINPFNYKMVANLFTYEQSYRLNNIKSVFPYMDYWNINRNTEVVVKIPHIPGNWLHSCITKHTGKE